MPNDARATMDNTDQPTMKIIRVREEFAAIAEERRVTLSPEYNALPEGHPDLRLAVWKAYYARDIITGELPGPFTDAAAERYARDALIPAETFPGLADRPDRILADHYRVPIEQIALRRQDLG